MTKFKNEVHLKGQLVSFLPCGCDCKKEMLSLIIDDGYNKISIFVPDESNAKIIESDYSIGDFVSVDAMLSSAVLKKDGKKTTVNSIVLSGISKLDEPEYENSFEVCGAVVKTAVYNCYGYISLCVIKDAHATVIPFVFYGNNEEIESIISVFNEGEMISFTGKIQTRCEESFDGQKKYMTNFVVSKSVFANC